MMSNSWWWHVDSAVPNHTMITFKEELFGHFKRTDCCWTDSIKAQPAWLWDFPEPHNRKGTTTVSHFHPLIHYHVSEAVLMYQRVPSCERRESSVSKHAVSPASVCPRSLRPSSEATSSDHRPFTTLSYGDSHHRNWKLFFEHTIGHRRYSKPFLFPFKTMFWTSSTTICLGCHPST